MTFALPPLLWLLLLVPLLAWFLAAAWRRKQALIAQFVQSRLLAQLTVGVSKPLQKLRLVLLVAAVATATFALARPQWGFTWEEVSQKGLDIVVAIDTSRSMLAEDVKPNRLERAKLAAIDLMKLARTDRLGLVAFAGSSFLQCPLTLDEEAFRQSVQALDVNIIPQGGTALAETIQTALSAFKEGDNHKILVLFTDGEDHETGAVEAAKRAAGEGLRIFPVGIGTTDGELVRIRDAGGKLDFLKDNEGNVVKSRLNERLLQELAGAANGFYLNLRGPNTMAMLYERGLAPLPKSEFSARMIRRYHERFYWPLAVAIVLLMVEMFLPERRKVTRSSVAPMPPAKAALPALTTALALLLGGGSASASPGDALRQYRAGKYEDAFKEYQRLRDAKPEDARRQFNAGAAAYQAQQFEEAARSFSAAAGAPEVGLQQGAFYNLGNSLYQLGERTPEVPRKSEAWRSAIEFYNTALKLNAQDKDAEHNRDFVKRRLEELQKQEREEKKDEQKKEEKKDSGKPDPPENSKPEPGKPEEPKKDQPEKGDGKKPEDQKPDAPPDPKQGDQKREPKEQPPKGKEGQPPKPNEPGERGETPSPQDYAARGQMSPQQAQQLLDSQKAEERALIFQPTNSARANQRFLKNW